MSRHLSMEKYINAQVKYWEQAKARIDIEEDEKIHAPFVTISREYGCGGYDLGKKIIEIINENYNPNPLWAAYDRQVLDKVMEDMGLSSKLAKTLTDDALKSMTNVIQTTFTKFPPQVAVYRKLAETIKMLAANGNVIIVGRAGNVITRFMKGGYNVRVIAQMDYKVKNVMENQNLSAREAEKLIQANTERRNNYIREFVEFDVTDPGNYDIMINLSRINIDNAARLILEGMKFRGFLK